jgi:hypothetical protein
MKHVVAVALLTMAGVQPPWISLYAAAIDTETSSGKRVDALHIKDGAAYYALAELSRKTGVAVGVDAVLPEREVTIDIDFQGGTVAEWLNMFIAQAPEYRWDEVGDGVIHVSRSNAHVTLLDTPIAFPGATNKTRHEIWNDIANRPEVTAWLRANACIRAEYLGAREFREHNEPISIPSGTITLEQLLDQLVVKSGVNYWAVLESKSGKECRVDIVVW